MNKNELIQAVSEKVGYDKSSTKEFIEGFVDTIKEKLKDGESIQLVGFGTFKTDVRSARKGRNPKTGEAIDIPEKTVVKFKPASSILS